MFGDQAVHDCGQPNDTESLVARLMHYGDPTAMSVMDLRTGVAAPVGRGAAPLSAVVPNDGR